MRKEKENFCFTFAVYFHFNVNLIMKPLKVDHVSHIAMKSMKSKPSYLVKLPMCQSTYWACKMLLKLIVLILNYFKSRDGILEKDKNPNGDIFRISKLDWHTSNV